jgi:hypothetical protein
MESQIFFFPSCYRDLTAKKLEFDMPAKSLEMVISATPMELYITSEINRLKPAKSLDVCRRNYRGNNRRNEIDWSIPAKSLELNQQSTGVIPARYWSKASKVTI